MTPGAPFTSHFTSLLTSHFTSIILVSLTSKVAQVYFFYSCHYFTLISLLFFHLSFFTLHTPTTAHSSHIHYINRQTSLYPWHSPDAMEKGNNVVMTSMSRWRLYDAPEDHGVVTPNKWANNQVCCDPHHALLTDAGCVFALLTLSRKERYKIFTYDFDTRGNI